ncbi:hypothetical protein NOVO_06265 [Rickettsiales bacterium Ac37b]|nr:hypothetical protein NOVO_06265 [Rickettsiales bacterium Ac37b]
MEINLEQLEIFSLLLIDYAENIHNPNNNKQIDFLGNKFVQHITKFINHGLPANLQERNNFYLHALEESVTKLEYYRDTTCTNNVIDAISYHLARIGEIRNQFSHRFKLDNNFLLNNIINDDFREIRNSLVHGDIIDREIISTTIAKVQEIAYGIQNSVAAKNIFIKDDFKPIFIG